MTLIVLSDPNSIIWTIIPVHVHISLIVLKTFSSSMFVQIETQIIEFGWFILYAFFIVYVSFFFSSSHLFIEEMNYFSCWILHILNLFGCIFVVLFHLFLYVPLFLVNG